MRPTGRTRLWEVIRTADGYEFFASDGGRHSRQMWPGHWVGDNNYGSVVTSTGTLDNPLGTPSARFTQTARAFGDVVAVPTMLLFDRSRKPCELYGAPPDLHEQAEKILGDLVK